MKTRVLGVMAVAVLVGCGSSGTGDPLCDKAASVGASLNTKAQACGGTPSFDGAECIAAIANCDAGDRVVVDGFLDCANALPVCTLDNKTAFDAAAQACIPQQSSMTAPCYAALSGSLAD